MVYRVRLAISLVENGENHRAAEEVTGVVDSLLLHIRKCSGEVKGTPI